MALADEVEEVLAQRKLSAWRRTIITSLLLAESVETGGGGGGPPGPSAFEVAVANGFTGTEIEWLDSLVGPPGEDGADGVGQDGVDGLSAYEVAVADGYVGTITAWLESLVGPPGEDGEGTVGPDGLSAYALAVAGGFVGTVEEWLTSLIGPQGDPGTPGDPLDFWPVGSIYWRNDATNPGSIIGGTWARYGEDRTLVSQGATFDTAGETGGSDTVTLTAAQSGVPAHTHVEQNNSATTGSLAGWAARDTSTNTPVATGYSTQANTPANAAQAHENMPPYIVAYAWVRTA